MSFAMHFPTRAARTLSAAGFCVAAVLAMASTAQADTLYTQPFAETASLGYYAAEQGDYLQFDSFSLATSASISSVSWYGFSLGELLPGSEINPSEFLVAFYADNGSGQPGTLLSSSTLGNSAGVVDTGEKYSGLSLFSYSGTLSTSFQASAGSTYWIKIIDPTLNGNWFWASGAGPDGSHIGIIGGDTGTYVDDMSFSLQGSTAPVPEPSTTAMLSLGVLALGLAAARRRKAGAR